MKKIFLLLLATFQVMSPFPARADVENVFTQVQCLEELNTLKIDVFYANGELPRKNAIENHRALWKEKRIILHDVLIERDPNFKWQQSLPIETQCALYEEQKSEGKKKPELKKQTYFITLEPYLFNANPQWECGGANTFEITIKTKERILVDHFRFWYDCLGHQDSKMNDQITDTLLFLPHKGYVSFNGYYNNPKEVGDIIFYENFTRTLWLRDKLPITSEMIYSEKAP